MDDKVKKNLGLAIRIIIPVVLIYLLFRNLDWKTVAQTLRGYPLWILAAAVLMYVGANFLFAFRWHYFLKSVHIDIPYTYVVSLVFYSLFLSNFLPTTIGGDLVKVAGILNRDGPERKSIKISSVVADRIFSFGSKILLLPFTLYIFKGFVPVDFKLPWLQSLVFIKWLPKKWQAKAEGYWQAVKPWFSFRQIASVLGISWLSLLINILSFWMAIRVLNPSVSAIQIFCVTLLTYFASILPITINGIGVQEGSITYLLTLIGFTYEQGIAAALLIRVITIIVSLLGGVWLLISGKDLWKSIRSGKMTDFSKDLEKPGEKEAE
jgi:uncharacterized membrane protein YbhN (UPF0104 family)